MRVEIRQDTTEPTYVEIHCKDVTDEVTRLERHIRRYQAALTATEGDTTYNVALDAILYAESVDKKTFLYTEGKVLLTDKRLYELEEMLDKRDFFRCSKSTILNLNKVVKLKPELTRNIMATLTNGETIVVSRRYATELKSLIGIGK